MRKLDEAYHERNRTYIPGYARFLGRHGRRVEAGRSGRLDFFCPGFHSYRGRAGASRKSVRCCECFHPGIPAAGDSGTAPAGPAAFTCLFLLWGDKYPEEEVNRLATQLAEQRKVTKTEAVRLALANELARKAEEKSLWEKIAPIRASIAAAPKTGLPADKAFFDEINGDY